MYFVGDEHCTKHILATILLLYWRPPMLNMLIVENNGVYSSTKDDLFLLSLKATLLLSDILRTIVYGIYYFHCSSYLSDQLSISNCATVKVTSHRPVTVPTLAILGATAAIDPPQTSYHLWGIFLPGFIVQEVLGNSSVLMMGQSAEAPIFMVE